MKSLVVLGTLLCSVAHAHFQVVLPSTDSVSDPKHAQISFTISFTHPMDQGPMMNMPAPKEFGVLVDGTRTSLTDTLKPVLVGDKTTYGAAYTLTRPGAHIFYLEPSPYYDSTEKALIQHYTKVIVDAFGAWSGWNELVGFPVEIKPLTRPYGLWAGNVFQGVILHDGKPVPNAALEIEYYNENKRITPPTATHTTQIITADANGVFTYAMPWDGIGGDSRR